VKRGAWQGWGTKLYYFITNLTGHGGGKKGLAKRAQKRPKEPKSFGLDFWSPADLRADFGVVADRFLAKALAQNRSQWLLLSWWLVILGDGQ
jgi:hypothetical protein